jgi:hypothetical protein
MINPADIHEGMTVKDQQGRRLGTVETVGDTHFELGQGSPIRRDYMVHFHRVASVQGSEVVLSAAHAPVVPEDETPPQGR